MNRRTAIHVDGYAILQRDPDDFYETGVTKKKTQTSQDVHTNCSSMNERMIVSNPISKTW